MRWHTVYNQLQYLQAIIFMIFFNLFVLNPWIATSI
jgi:hypothetical protein